MLRFITRSFTGLEEKEKNPAVVKFTKSNAFNGYKLPALLDIDKVISLLPENPTEEDCDKVLKLSLFSFMGTDGMRGKVSIEKFSYKDAICKYLNENLITAALLEISVKAFVRMMKETHRALNVCIGNDSRDKTTNWTLINAVKNTFLGCGANVTDLDITPTPYVPQYMLANDIPGGAVLTASHNPSNQNGIKFFFDGKKLLSDGTDGDFILSAYMLQEAMNEPCDGERKYTAIDYLESAIKFLENTISPEYKEKFKNCKIIADTANGAWSLYAKLYFERNKINAELLNFKPEGENINHNCGVAEIEGHAAFTKDELKSAPEVIRQVYDQGKSSSKNVYGIAVDGDGDRGFVMKYDKASDSVIVYDGDAESFLIESLIYDKSHKGRTAVFTIESDLMVGLEMQDKFGLVPHMVDVGDKWICNQDPKNLEIGFESSGHVILPCKVRNTEKILLTGNGLLTALMTIASMEAGNKSFEKGYSNTLYTYFVKKELFYNGSPLWNEDVELIQKEIKALGEFTLENVQMKDPNVLVYYVLKDGKKCALIFIRNSGTEDKNAVYLKCRSGIEEKLLPVVQKLRELHRAKMLDSSREEVVLENEILKIIREKGHFVKKDLCSAESGTVESALHALVKERIISNHSDSYYPVA